ncbi:MAG: type VII secretion AAA-ATPase EccA [Mycobacterium sp.]
MLTSSGSDEGREEGVAAAPMTQVDPDAASRFATCCLALGLPVKGRRRPADLDAARSGFTALTSIAHDQCDGWVGLAVAGDTSERVLSAICSTTPTAGALREKVGLSPDALGFGYDSGLYLQFRACEPDGFALALAANAILRGKLAHGHDLIVEVASRSTFSIEALWMHAAVHYRAERWSDVVALLTPLVGEAKPALDALVAHAVRIVLGISLARLGMFAPALSYLEDPSGPIEVATIDGKLAKALALRSHGEDMEAADLLHELYASRPDHNMIEEALADPTFGFVTTTAARIAARSDVWDPATEPSEADFIDPGAKERKAELLSLAEQQLAEFIGLDEVKTQVARLKSSVAMSLLRQQRGLTVAQRTHHLVFAGPPGTGKTTIARVVTKIYCGLGLLRRENVCEVHRADLVGQHIGETEAKTNAVIDSALDGVLFLDEAYALVSTGAKNDFGLVAIDTMLARMENDRDRLVVIVAGYRTELDRFLDTNEGLRSRFTRSIDFPSYSPSELVEIASTMAKTRDSVFDDAACAEMLTVFDALCASESPDAHGIARRRIDIAGNGRFVRNIVERSEEEREHRLDTRQLSGNFAAGEHLTDQELMTITVDDVRTSIAALLGGLGLQVPT